MPSRLGPRSKANSKSNGGVSTLGTSPCKRVRFQLESKVATLRGGLSQDTAESAGGERVRPLLGPSWCRETSPRPTARSPSACLAALRSSRRTSSSLGRATCTESFTIKPLSDVRRRGALKSQYTDAGVIKSHPQVIGRPLFPRFLMRGSRRSSASRRCLRLRRPWGLVSSSESARSSTKTSCGVARGGGGPRLQGEQDDESTSAAHQRQRLFRRAQRARSHEATHLRLPPLLWLASEDASPHPDAVDNRKLRAVQAYARDDDYVWLDYC